MDSFFELWVKDKQSIIALMKRNMQSDIDAGYDRCSSSIVRQTVEK